MSKPATRSRPIHPVQTMLWAEFADVHPGITPRGDGVDLVVDVLISDLSVEETRALLLAAREIIRRRAGVVGESAGPEAEGG